MGFFTRLPPHAYVKWLSASDRAAANHHKITRQTNNYDALKASATSQHDSYHAEKELCDNEKLFEPIEHFADFDANDPSPDIASLDFPIRRGHSIWITNCRVGRLFIRGQFRGRLCIRNSWIRRLELRQLEANRVFRILLDMEGCWIGNISIIPESIIDWRFHEGGILSVNCPPSYEKNLFSGSVELKRVFFPSKDGMFNGNELGSQPWTNVKDHLISSGNPAAASMFHSTALAIERRNYAWYSVDRWIGAVYEYGGDYGSSISKPICSLVVLWLLVGAVYYAGDAAAIRGSNEDMENWRSIFTVTGRAGSVARSFWLSGHSTINPFGLLIGEPPVEASSFFWQAVLTIQRLSSIVLLFLSAVAIRRRFRMSAG